MLILYIFLMTFCVLLLIGATSMAITFKLEAMHKDIKKLTPPSADPEKEEDGCPCGSGVMLGKCPECGNEIGRIL